MADVQAVHPQNRLVPIPCRYRGQTSKAWLVEINGKQLRMPKSKCAFLDELIMVPRWLVNATRMEKA